MPHRILLITLGVVAAATGAAIASPAGDSAHLIPRDRPPFPQPGDRVAQRDLGTRTFVNRDDGFALAELSGRRVGGGATFPAKTTDGGRTWRIAGPHLHVDAADAPDAVSGSGMGARRLFFAFGGAAGGQAVDVTTDAGGHWWRIYLPAPAEAIAVRHLARRTRLIAFLETSPVSAYVSGDGGRHWRYTRSPG